MLPARQLAGRNFSHAIHGTTQRFSVAGTRFEIGPTHAAVETPDRFLVDRVDPGSCTFVLASVANSKGRRPQRSGFAFYKWNHRRTKGSRNQPPQHRRNCLAVSDTTGCAREVRDHLIAAAPSHF